MTEGHGKTNLRQLKIQFTRRSCREDKLEYGSTSCIYSVHSGALGGTVSPLVTFPATGQGSRKRAQLVCIVSHKRQMQEAVLAITDLPIYPFIFFSPREYEGAVDFTGSTFLCAWWGRERELVGKEIIGVTQH